MKDDPVHEPTLRQAAASPVAAATLLRAEAAKALDRATAQWKAAIRAEYARGVGPGRIAHDAGIDRTRVHQIVNGR